MNYNTLLSLEEMLKHRKKHRQMHSSYLAKGRTVDAESTVTTAERTPSERMKHSNTVAVYLVQGQVDSRRADTGN